MNKKDNRWENAPNDYFNGLAYMNAWEAMMRTLTAVLLICSCISPCFSQTVFTDVTEEAGIDHAFQVFQGTFGGGVAVFDYNNDGFEDLYIAGGLGRDSFYKNNGNGPDGYPTFTDLTVEAGFSLKDTLITQGAVCADVNRDGYTDVLVTTIASYSGIEIPRASDILYINNGDGTFRDATLLYGLGEIQTFSTGAAFGDINADGYPDLFVGNYFDQFEGDLGKISGGTITGGQRPSSDQLYLNIGGEYFQNITEAYGIAYKGFGFGATFTDFDNDHDLDLFVINDFGNRATPNLLFRNNYPEQSFADVSAEYEVDFGINAMGTAVGDYNNDGWMDYFITNMSTSIFLVNQGADKPFINKTRELGTAYPIIYDESGRGMLPVSWGANFFDYDNDTDLDLFICNGALNPPSIPNPNMFLENRNFQFIDMSRNAGLADPGIGRGSVTFDYDNDGDLDLFVVNQQPVGDEAKVETIKSKLYRNDASSGNWLKVKLEGVAADRNGIGSRVTVIAGALHLIREIDGGSSHASQNSTIAHFGLADIEQVDSLIVKWIGGKTQVLTDIDANQTIEIREEMSAGSNPFDQSKIVIYPNHFSNEAVISYEFSNHTSFTLEVFDVLGRRIEVLIDQGEGNAGAHYWSVPSSLRAGMYYFVIRSPHGSIYTKGIKR